MRGDGRDGRVGQRIRGGMWRRHAAWRKRFGLGDWRSRVAGVDDGRRLPAEGRELWMRKLVVGHEAYRGRARPFRRVGWRGSLQGCVREGRE